MFERFIFFEIFYLNLKQKDCHYQSEIIRQLNINGVWSRQHIKIKTERYYMTLLFQNTFIIYPVLIDF